MKKKITFLLTCPLGIGGGGLRALTDMYAENVIFLNGSPYLNVFTCLIVLLCALLLVLYRALGQRHK